MSSGLSIQEYEQVIIKLGFTIVVPVHFPQFYISLHHR